MIESSYSADAGPSEASEAEKIKSIEDLLIGSGAMAFTSLEHRISGFCPFEAIGMVQQEIRHAHFLCYILDPQRPHNFGDGVLKSLIQSILDQAEDDKLTVQPLDIHLSDFSNAIVYRERADIDLLVEIPANSIRGRRKGLIVTVELKVHAREAEGQLTKYRNHVEGVYPSDQWDHIYAFVTLEGDDPSESNREAWVPLSLGHFLSAVDAVVAEERLTGEAVELYNKYAAMIRRHLLADEELISLTKSIWSKHKEALDVLMEYRPDFQAEIFQWLGDNDGVLVDKVRTFGFELRKDTSSQSYLRFQVTNWADLPNFQSEDQSWVQSGSVLVLELKKSVGGKIGASFVLGPGDDACRHDIYEAIRRDYSTGPHRIGRLSDKIGRHKRLSSAQLQTKDQYDKLVLNEDQTADKVGEKLFKKLAEFLGETLPGYDRILRTVLVEV